MQKERSEYARMCMPADASRGDAEVKATHSSLGPSISSASWPSTRLTLSMARMDAGLYCVWIALAATGWSYPMQHARCFASPGVGGGEGISTWHMRCSARGKRQHSATRVTPIRRTRACPRARCAEAAPRPRGCARGPGPEAE